MRKVFLCALVILGVMNSCFGQGNIKSEWITVQTYPFSGPAEQFHLKGNDALAFDIPAFIKENDHLERLVINGTLRTALLTTDIKFDSDNQDQEGEYICKEVQSKVTPFLGVWGTGSKDHDGVDIKEIIPTTAADRAGITADESITEYNGVAINNFRELKKAVLASTIGDHVKVKLEQDANQYAQDVIVGSRGLHTVTYKYCVEEQAELLSSINQDAIAYSFNAYPNPTTDQSHINFESSSEEDVIFSVTTLAGKQIHNEVFSNFNGSLSLDYTFINENEGIYIFTIQQGQELYKRKVTFLK